ncbi:hypothetical protein PAHAL_4G357800 [Panicum hallii]|uniref:Uncharacterized protein n=1 Tax=Panicum hallii TaxID=206008 RepID=A0A2T8JF73_9POAL|nr:hypothetical protein PAHAL_4G357800 [Panicum hallii]
MPSASRRRPPPPHRRRAMLPTSSTLSVVSAPTPPKPLYLRRSLIAAAAASLAVLLLLAAAYAPWRSDLPPAALLGRPAAPTARFYSFDLVREYPHDPDAFTQGLLYGGNDTLFESTGLYHRSSVRMVELPTGKVLVHHEMDGDMFGEGLTLLGSRCLNLKLTLYPITYLPDLFPFPLFHPVDYFKSPG